MPTPSQHRWLTRQALSAADVPAGVMDWLFDKSSLTDRLIRLCEDRDSGAFHVVVLDQSVSEPYPDEREVLAIEQGAALIRQVHLYSGDTALVYARTVIPETTLTGEQRRYAELGDRPLGAMLFKDETMRREEVMVTRLQPGDAVHRQTGVADEDVWGRRSVFYVSEKPLLVSEFFLPALLELANR